MPTSRRIVDSEGEDFYPTPAWATRALIASEEFEGNIWEPACGNGAISEILLEGHQVYSSDLHDRGYGHANKDFLKTEMSDVDNIITNPPYNLAEEFVLRGVKLANKKLALLLRLSFLESARRYNSIFRPMQPTRVLVFSERITFYPNGLQTAGTGTLAYAWFVWDNDNPTPYHTELLWLPPIFKTDTKFDGPSQAISINLDLEL